MSVEKKLFTSEDFDKQKKLFTAEDFDKEKELSPDSVVTGGPAPKPEEQSWWKRYKKQCILIGVVVAVIALIAAMIYSSGQGHNGTVGSDTVAVVQNDTIPSDTTSTEVALPQEKTPVPQEASRGNGVKTSQMEGLQATETATDASSIESKAKDVIRGKYGNGQIRKDKLGASYAEIQSKVNEMYRNGLVK